MNGNYQTAKFLANERINDQLALARQHRLANKSQKSRRHRDRQLTLAKATKRAAVMAVQLATAIKSLGNVIVATR